MATSSVEMKPNIRAYYYSSGGTSLTANANKDFDISGVMPAGKNPWAVLVWVYSYSGNISYAMPYANDSGSVQTWVVGLYDNYNTLRLRSTIAWGNCNVFATFLCSD